MALKSIPMKSIKQVLAVPGDEETFGYIYILTDHGLFMRTQPHPNADGLFHEVELFYEVDERPL